MNTYTSENYSVYPGEFVPVMDEENIIEQSKNAEDDNLRASDIIVKEFTDKYEVCVSAPGLSREKLIVYADDNLLLVCTSKNERIMQTDSSFQRHINLPVDADTELAVAEYTNSVLHCYIPKTKQHSKHTTTRIVVY